MADGVLGIIAGAGELPLAIARIVQQDRRPVFVLALEGSADSGAFSGFPHAAVQIGEVARAVQLLKDAGCTAVTLAGRIARPEFSRIKLDRLGTMHLPRIVAAALRGDDALLRAVIAMFEKEGFRVLGTAEVTRSLLAPEGPLGAEAPGAQDSADIEIGCRVVQALGGLDVGQAAVVCGGLTLAVEAAEGTDQMLRRVADLPPQLRGTALMRRGVLVKAAKPRQERRVDLPVIGPATIKLAAAAGLAGVAVQAGSVLVVDRTSVAGLASASGLFVYGFSGMEHTRG